MQWNVLVNSQAAMSSSPGKRWVMSLSLGVLFISGLCCHGAARAAQVYECKVNGNRIFSDQPCADDAIKREIVDVNSMSAKEAEIGYRASPSQRHKRDVKTDEANPRDKQRERCAKLSGDKQTINSKLRAGYSNNQGERLRERLRKVDAEYFELRCNSAQ